MINMSKGHKKWLRQEKAHDDKHQATFGASSQLLPTDAQTMKAQFTDKTDQQVMCPFCLYQDQLLAFLINRKKGYDRRLGMCPECKAKSMIRTLTEDITPEQYADFAYSYKGYGFWQKVKFETWKERLWAIGWAGRFWERYKQLKGENQQEPYEDMINRQAQEAYAQEM